MSKQKDFTNLRNTLGLLTVGNVERHIEIRSFEKLNRRLESVLEHDQSQMTMEEHFTILSVSSLLFHIKRKFNKKMQLAADEIYQAMKILEIKNNPKAAAFIDFEPNENSQLEKPWYAGGQYE